MRALPGDISDRKVRCHLVRSAWPTRHTSGQHLAHDCAIDVLSGHDEADAASLHAGAFLDERRERRGAGALRERVGIAGIYAVRLVTLRFADIGDPMYPRSTD